MRSPGGQGQKPLPGQRQQMPMQAGGGMTQGMAQGQPPQQQPQGMGAAMQPITIDDIIQTEVVTAEPSATITDVTEQMAEEEVGSVVIVEDDEPVGLVTDRKIALSLTEMPDLAEEEVESIMTEELTTGSAEMTLMQALEEMSAEGIRRLPIVDEDGSLAGIVTLDDILVLLCHEMDTAAEIIEMQSPRL